MFLIPLNNTEQYIYIYVCVCWHLLKYTSDTYGVSFTTSEIHDCCMLTMFINVPIYFCMYLQQFSINIIRLSDILNIPLYRIIIIVRFIKFASILERNPI